MRQLVKIVAAALCALQLTACAGLGFHVEHDLRMSVNADHGSRLIVPLATSVYDVAKDALCPHGVYAESRHASVQTWTERENPRTNRVQQKARINGAARAQC